eukprot:CAMPEP_0170259558 /NCGR_PEP_ID=MMETSP0116_2-20130129/29651_1 /TAXON_ID=400756 /ORGANISM="Durinskia baltica, Strain CSIRO CS-38" /LENGTH=273 /DNA_ID=CAMNT_0010510605 /DNA_START=83 /DNA_END=905 /DNA_ORIENTATION=-
MAKFHESNVDYEVFTTLLVRHVPRKYVAWDMVIELDRFLDRKLLDFVYVPHVNGVSNNMGYAFVNCPNPSVARTLLERMQGQPWADVNTTRKMQVKPAYVQGLATNLRQFQDKVAHRNESVMEHVPLVFERGMLLIIQEAIAKYCTQQAVAREKEFFDMYVKTVPQTSAKKEFQAEVITGVDFFDDCPEELEEPPRPLPMYETALWQQKLTPPRSKELATSWGAVLSRVSVASAQLVSRGLWVIYKAKRSPPGSARSMSDVDRGHVSLVEPLR